MSHSDPRHPMPRPRELRCESCGTGHRLTIHAVTAMETGNSELVSVSYTCADCQRFHEHAAYASDMVAALHQIRPIARVILFGDDYMHCGFPMEEAGLVMERLCYRSSTTGGGINTLSLPVRVLRCHCGFQLEVPG